MRKRNLLKAAVLAAAVISMLLLAACGGEPEQGNTEQSSPQTSAGEESERSSSTDEENSETSVTPSESKGETVAKINGGADDTGIYSIVVRLTKQAADKGVIELVYYGPKGSPQENSIVNTFRIEYWKDEAGTFEIRTFSNGEVYQNQHKKEEVKVTNTFDASLRAGLVIISYTPDGGETQEIFRADADYFRG